MHRKIKARRTKNASKIWKTRKRNRGLRDRRGACMRSIHEIKLQSQQKLISHGNPCVALQTISWPRRQKTAPMARFVWHIQCCCCFSFLIWKCVLRAIALHSQTCCAVCNWLFPENCTLRCTTLGYQISAMVTCSQSWIALQLSDKHIVKNFLKNENRDWELVQFRKRDLVSKVPICYTNIFCCRIFNMSSKREVMISEVRS